MLTYPLATAAFLVGMQGAASADASIKKTPTKIDFMRAMNARVNNKNKRRRRLNLKDFQAVVQGDSKKSAELRKKIMEKSTVVKPPGAGRKLEDAAANDGANANANYYNNANNANYNNAYNNNGGNQQGNYKYNQYKDGTDDYFMAYGEWENEFGFDPTMFSLSYNRCAAVRQFDDEIAASEETTSVFATKHFAVFRFCPEQTCMGWQVEEADCGCEDQCEEIFEDMGNYGYEAGDDDSGSCEEACQAQCDIWEQQYGLYGGGQGQADGAERKLQNQNYYGANSYSYNRFSQMTFDPYYVQDNEEEEVVGGARGDGCQNNYGEYMIEMKDFLEMMLQDQEERFEEYCEYCEECMWLVYQEWLENGDNMWDDDNEDNNRNLKYEEFKATVKHRELNNNNENSNDRLKSNYYEQCPEYDTCIEYQQTCKNGIQDEYSDYFECTEVEKANGQVAYIGPHCAEDGIEITLGVYADEYCNEYIGNGVDIANFLGEELEEDALKSYYNSAYGPTLEQLKYVNEDNVCIPCRKADLMWVEGTEYNGGNRGDDEDEEDDDNDGNVYNYRETEINELCSNLYQVSARCDKNFRSYNTKTKQAKYAEYVAQEDLTCDFIDSVVMGSYNEMGEINLKNNYSMQNQQSSSGWLGDNMYAQQYRQAASQVSPWQIFGLIATILAVVLLAFWSMTLHKSLTKTGPWRPRRGLQSSAASPPDADLSRQNSGIVMGRSSTNASYYMS